MNKPTIESEYFYQLQDLLKFKDEDIRTKLIEFLSTVRPKKQRTLTQNRALHKDCDLIAEKLNNSGIEIRTFFKEWYFIPWTTESVKAHIWKPIQKSMYQKDSTTELDKNSEEINKIHEVIMRELGEKWGIEYHPFPFDPEKKYESNTT